MPQATPTPARPLELTELMTLLLEVSERINSTLDLEELMTRVAELVKRAIDYGIFAILLLNEKSQELYVRFSSGHPDEVVRNLRIKVGEGIVGRAAQTRRSVLVNDVLRDATYIESLPAMRSELAVPLIAKGRVIGVMDLESPWKHFFTERHQNLLELLAGRIATAIENARLYRRTLRQARTLHLLNDISRELSSVLVLNELLRKIGTLTKRLIDYQRLGILLADERSRTFNTVISIKQDERMPEKTSVPFGQGVVGAAAAARQPIVVPDVRRDPRYIATSPETRSEMAVPLVYRERVIGVVDLESPRLGYFTEEHLRIFSTLAPQIAVAIENARLYERVVRSEARLERDLERAREIQAHLMPPSSPAIAGLDVAARFQPARELGGDLYDFLAYGKDRHVIVIGDVSGKGAPAALYGAMVSGILRSLAPLRLPPTEMLKKLNVTLLERKIDGHFITLAYGIWDPRNRSLRLANSGMPLPILVRRGRSQSIRAEGVPLGLLEHTEYQETGLTLERGDLLALFSDGMVEANNPQMEEFGVRRLENLLRQQARRPVAAIMERIFAEVARFEHGAPRRDDQTLLLIRAR
ncbi:MAG TPA: SpoIIE family protein phosphatase [Candidatus Sulfopaludibacter sp.]|nr:SpoIIE family protein phosphatase [Terriglobia bacterium]HEV2444717.1 SpoIIE family protein phosphatase [Candidatus Sulfopaludibacter sp.]